MTFLCHLEYDDDGKKNQMELKIFKNKTFEIYLSHFSISEEKLENFSDKLISFLSFVGMFKKIDTI